MFLEPLPPRFIITPIVGRVQAELAETQRREPLTELEKRARDARPVRDFERAVADGFGLIAEIKRTSQILSDLCLQYATLVSCVFISTEQMEEAGTGFFRNVNREGIPV